MTFAGLLAERLNRNGFECGEGCLGIRDAEGPKIPRGGVEARCGQRAAVHAGQAPEMLHTVVLHTLLNQRFAQTPVVVGSIGIRDLMRAGNRDPVHWRRTVPN